MVWYIMCKYEVEGNVPVKSVANVRRMKMLAVAPDNPVDLGAPCVNVDENLCSLNTEGCETTREDDINLGYFCPVTCGEC